MKLELKHYLPYLNHNVTIETLVQVFEGNPPEPSHDEITTTTLTLDNAKQHIDHGFRMFLRPLSDLTEEEFTFVYENETDYDSIEQLVQLDTESFLTCCFSYGFWQLLFREHFDVFGLIEKGLAVDINTLKQ